MPYFYSFRLLLHPPRYTLFPYTTLFRSWEPPFGLVSSTAYFKVYVAPRVTAADSPNYSARLQSLYQRVNQAAVAGKTYFKTSPADSMASEPSATQPLNIQKRTVSTRRPI